MATLPNLPAEASQQDMLSAELRAELSLSSLGAETIEDKANMELTRSGYGRVAVLQRDNLRKYEEVKHCLCLVCFHCLRG